MILTHGKRNEFIFILEETDLKYIFMSALILWPEYELIYLAGKDDFEQAQILALITFFEDFLKEIQTWFSTALGFGQGDKVNFRKKLR